MSEMYLDRLASRFVAAPLPANVAADGCATDANYPHPRYGTNLLTAGQAKEVLRHVLDGFEVLEDAPEWDGELSDAEHAMIDRAWDQHKAAQPASKPHPAPSPSEVGPEVVERMIALVRGMASNDDPHPHYDEARAIVALLPEPVDADLIEAREVAAAVFDNGGSHPSIASGLRAGKRDGGIDVTVALAAIKRGRALEKEAGR